LINKERLLSNVNSKFTIENSCSSYPIFNDNSSILSLGFVPPNVNYTPRNSINALENRTICVTQELIELKTARYQFL